MKVKTTFTVMLVILITILSSCEKPNESSGESSTIKAEQSQDGSGYTSEQDDYTPTSEWDGVWTDGSNRLLIYGDTMHMVVQGEGNYKIDGTLEKTGNTISRIMLDPAFDYEAYYTLTLNGNTITYLHEYGANKQVIGDSGTYTRTNGDPVAERKAAFGK